MPDADPRHAQGLSSESQRLSQPGSRPVAVASFSSTLAASRGILASGVNILAPFGAGCCFAVRASRSSDLDNSERAGAAADVAATGEEAPRRKLWRDPMPPNRRKKPQRESSDDTVTVTFGPANTHQVGAPRAVPMLAAHVQNAPRAMRITNASLSSGSP